MKKIIIIIIILILGSSILNGCIKKGSGVLIIMIKDKPPELNITKALVTISSVAVHKTSLRNNKDYDNSSGWINLVNETQIFDLIQLQHITDKLAEKNMDVGIYSQIRLYVEEAIITVDGVEHDLIIPSKKVKIKSNFLIFDEEKTFLTLDFDIHKSVHKTGNDKYMLKPNIKLV